MKPAEPGPQRLVELVCPCCGARLTVDAQLGAVVSHEPPPAKRAHLETDFSEAARRLKEEEERRDEVFRKSVEAQKKRGQVLERKFEESFKKVKDQPIEKPQRDIDLD